MYVCHREVEGLIYVHTYVIKSERREVYYSACNLAMHVYYYTCT